MPVGVAFGCARCGGVLLDDAAFGHVREQLCARIVEQANLEAAPSRARDVSPLLSCPVCRQVMTRTSVERVEVDFCREHGTWFDRDELVAIARACVIARAYAPPPAPAAPHRQGEGRGRVLTAEEREALARSVADRGVGSLVTDAVSGEGLLEAFADVASKGDRFS